MVWTKIAQLNHMSAMQFSDSLHGVCAGEGSIFFTTDGGIVWNAAVQPYHPLNFYDLGFSDSLNGWATGTLSGSDGIIWRSTDGGKSWNEQWSEENRSLLSVSVVSKDEGFISGSTLHGLPDTSKIYQTLNGGQGWTESVVSESLAVFSKVFFLDSLHGWMLGSARSGVPLVLRTVNGGAHWDIYTVQLSFQTLLFLDSLNGLTTAGSAFYATSDGGVHWNQTGTVQAESTSVQVYALRFLNRMDGWAFGGTTYRGILSEGIAHTTDGGTIWSIQSVGLSANQGEAISGTMFSDQLGFAICVDGSVLRYSGTTGVPVRAIALPSAFRLEQNYPNPFNPTTTIQYQLPNESFVHLVVFNILGEEVRTLVNETEQAGYRTVSFDGSSLPTGMYIYRITAGSFSNVKRMVLIK
jgi:photosystem II stability/assembly factor-like uncharacterized protein